MLEKIKNCTNDSLVKVAMAHEVVLPWYEKKFAMVLMQHELKICHGEKTIFLPCEYNTNAMVKKYRKVAMVKSKT